MATWIKNDEGQTEVGFAELDLTISRIAQTKKLLSEVIDHPSLKLDVKNIHECDSAGLQLLLLFIREVKHNKGKIVYSELPSEMEALCQLLGLEELLFLETLRGAHV